MRLREYIAKLEAAGELQRITTKVNTRFEITEITDRISKSEGGGKALLFENTGTEYPVLMNMMGSDKRTRSSEQQSNLNHKKQSIMAS